MTREQRYQEIANDLRSKIESGQYQPGQQLPSRVQLMAEYGASGTVIEKAMMILRLAGLTESLAGVGVFVAGQPTP